MKAVTLIVFTCLFLGCVSKEKKEVKDDDLTELKVMVWNILHGGHDDYLPADGRPDIIQIINDSETDVVLIMSCYQVTCVYSAVFPSPKK